MSEYMFSVVIPAHNEEKYIEKCINGIKKASEEALPCKTEIIVVANRCTDKTAEIAEGLGARVIVNDEKCIGSIRNSGVRAANGRIIITIDADSVMSEGALKEARKMLLSGKYIGGGTASKFDRMSFGIFCSTIYVAANIAPQMIKSKAALSGGMFWFFKEDFDRINGFDESLVSLEDLDFAKRLKELGDSVGKKYGTLKKSYITTSSRKFDEFGDWYLIKNKKLTKAIFTGKDREAADKFYYDLR
ncbi:MAG: glycosyltransferase [Oscillospiraceae bacterium]